MVSAAECCVEGSEIGKNVCVFVCACVCVRVLAVENPCSESSGPFLVWFSHEWMYNIIGNSPVSLLDLQLKWLVFFCVCVRVGWHCRCKYSLVGGCGQIRKHTYSGSVC